MQVGLRERAIAVVPLVATFFVRRKQPVQVVFAADLVVAVPVRTGQIDVDRDRVLFTRRAPGAVQVDVVSARVYTQQDALQQRLLGGVPGVVGAASQHHRAQRRVYGKREVLI